MTQWRADRRVWGVPETSAALALVLLPFVSVLAVARDRETWDSLDAAASITLGSLGLFTAALLLVHGRLGTNGQTTWLAAGPGVIGTVTFAQGLSEIAWRRDGAVLTVTDPGRSGTGEVVIAAVAVVAAAGLVWRCLRLTGLPAWTAPRLVAAAVLAAVAAAGDVPGGLGAPVPTLLVTAPTLVAAYLWLSTSAALLRQQVRESDEEVARLLAALALSESELRDSRTRLHQATTLTAGLASAQELVADLPDSPERDRLEVVVRDEAGRLQRLLVDRDHADGALRPAPARPVDLDAVVQRVVLTHRARGHRVTSEPGGLRARTDVDAVAEVLDILVENAARHAGSGSVTVTTRRSDHQVVFEVTDTGRGIAPDLRSSVFEWGTRADGSSGQGIGLYVANALARSLGGTLTLDDPDARGGATDRSGARFVLSVPDAPEGATPRASRSRVEH